MVLKIQNRRDKDLLAKYIAMEKKSYRTVLRRQEPATPRATL
jgi:hypothetical protein